MKNTNFKVLAVGRNWYGVKSYQVMTVSSLDNIESGDFESIAHIELLGIKTTVSTDNGRGITEITSGGGFDALNDSLIKDESINICDILDEMGDCI